MMIIKFIQRFGNYFVDYLLYNELAWSYDVVSWVVSLGEWQAWTHAALPFVQGVHVLEVAHGPGHLLRSMQLRGWHVVGVDLSPYMGRMAHRRLAKALLPKKLVRSRTQALPLRAEAFDSVVSTFPSSYILHPATLKNIARVLRPNGRLIIVPGGSLKGNSLVHRAIDVLYWATGQTSESVPEQGDMLRVSWTERIEAAGFEVTFEQVERPMSLCTVIVAQKIGG